MRTDKNNYSRTYKGLCFSQYIECHKCAKMPRTIRPNKNMCGTCYNLK